MEQIPAFETILADRRRAVYSSAGLAYLKASYTFNEEEQKPLGFIQGFFASGIKCKVIVYGLTLYGYVPAE